MREAEQLAEKGEDPREREALVERAERFRDEYDGKVKGLENRRGTS